jgi:tetratricopeptide (TPR) repeat protein
MAWADLGFCALALGNLEGAGEFFQKGLTIPTTQGLLQRPRFLLGSALVALARGQSEEAARFVREARTFVAERAMKHLYPVVAFTDAQVSTARGDPERGLEHFAHAEALALEMTMRPLVWQARAGAAGVLSALGRADEAEAKRREARAMIDEIAGLFEDDTMRALFVESAVRKAA